MRQPLRRWPAAPMVGAKAQLARRSEAAGSVAAAALCSSGGAAQRLRQLRQQESEQLEQRHERQTAEEEQEPVRCLLLCLSTVRASEIGAASRREHAE